MTRLAALATLLLLALATPADALTLTVRGHARFPEQRWLAWSQVPLPPGPVTVAEHYCPSDEIEIQPPEGCVFLPDGEIYLDAPRADARQVLLHEVGHVFDARVLTDQARTAFRGIFGWQQDWNRDEVRHDQVVANSAPIERFADAYRLCARHTAIRRPYHSPWAGGWTITPSQHRKACALIVAAIDGTYGSAVDGDLVPSGRT